MPKRSLNWPRAIPAVRDCRRIFPEPFAITAGRAEQGLPRAQLMLATLYSRGSGVKPDKAEAFAWMQRAADQGLAEAQLALGLHLRRGAGSGSGDNPIAALDYFKKAAAQNISEAVFETGQCYMEGTGAAKDIAEGVKWIRRAAEEGYAPAQQRLGLCYLKGEGMPKDNVQAYKWFNLAAAQGGELSLDARINLAKAQQFLSPTEVAEAQRLSREFTPFILGEAAVPAAMATPEIPANSGVVTISAPNDLHEIFVDGAFIGNSPAKVMLIEGRHLIEVRKSGFQDYRREIVISPGAELNLRPTLESVQP